ncbi:MAG: hypothetical protein Q7T55_02210 [Solirubrobacteraceae bacterium]|nr:hypothetical protein [Solirubrobacteraceae bacterium]
MHSNALHSRRLFRTAPARAAVAFGLAAGLAGSAAADAQASPPVAPKNGPACDQFGGTDLNRSPKWRIFITTAGDAADSDERGVYSCRRGSPRPALVRRVGTTSLAEISGGNVLATGTIVGDRVVVSATSGSSMGTSTSRWLLDLRTGRRLDLPGSASNNTPSTEPGLVAMTASGGLVTSRWVVTDPLGTTSYAPGGEVTTIDARGKTAGGAGIVAIAPSSAGTGNGVYTLDVSGAIGSVSTSGAVRSSMLGAPVAPIWQGKRLPRAPKSKKTARVFLDPAAPVTGFQLDRARGTIVLPTGSGPGRTIATLAPGEKSVTVRLVDRTRLVVDARFADAPGSVRTRLLTSYVGRELLLDQPAAALPGGSVAIGRSVGTMAAAVDGSRIRIWRDGEEQSPLSVPGASDLAFGAIGGGCRVVLFYRDAAGTPGMANLGCI